MNYERGLIKSKCKEHGQDFQRIWQRVHKCGWSLEKALSTPRFGSRNKKGSGYKSARVSGKVTSEHIAVAELALGKKLPNHTEIHHINGNRRDNRGNNLVICPNAAYHRLLHTRAEALEETGNPNYLKCLFCGKFDDSKNLVTKKTSERTRNFHKKCQYDCYKNYKTRKVA